MAKMNDEQVIGARKWLESIGATVNRMENPLFDWYAVPFQEVKDAPEMFAFSWKAPEAGHLIGVSTEVPREFRKYWAIHEFLEEPKEYPGKCLETLKQELVQYVPFIQLEKYIPLRAKFFRGLVEYAKARENKYSPETLAEFEASRDYLNEIEANFKK